MTTAQAFVPEKPIFGASYTQNSSKKYSLTSLLTPFFSLHFACNLHPNLCFVVPALKRNNYTS